MAIRSLSAGRPRLLVPVIVLIVVLIVVLAVFVGIYTDLLWFRDVGFGRVFTTVLGVRVGLFLGFGLTFSAVVCAHVLLAYRLRPPFRPLSPEQQALERYRVGVEPYLRPLFIALGGVLTLLGGLPASSRWQTWLLWRHRTPFGTLDPQFHRDVSFYAFVYPFYRFVLGYLFAATIISLLAAVAVHYLFGGVALQSQRDRVTSAARAHLSVLLGLFVALKAVAYYLDRFGLNFSRRGFVDTGASYTDVHAVLAAKTILIFIAAFCALLFFAVPFVRSWTLPGVSIVLLVVASLVIGLAYPAVVQQFSVKPNEASKELPYIQRNMDATRTAYGLTADKIKTIPYDATTTATPAQVASDTAAIPYTRLLDPNVLTPTFQQLQQVRSYYGFPAPLDIDRYQLNGRTQDYVVAVRDINLLGLAANQQNWINTHLAYTHGLGFVAAPADTVDPSNGQPRFIEGKLPPEGPIPIDRPQVYYGEDSPPYSVVGTTQDEIDGPQNGKEQTVTHYNGKTGVSVGGSVRRLLYAVKYRDKNLLLSSALTGSSKILYVRNPRDRVQKVAPWLTLDGDPYPAVVNGAITWIVDGYTTSDAYPYSARRPLGTVTNDQVVANQNLNRAAQQGQVNYIRNSVKATVDAYDGTVTLYQFDPTDPVLRTWMKAFPGTVQPRSAIPPALAAHFRYPEDLFKVQRDLLSLYHVGDLSRPASPADARDFYSGQDFWTVPNDPNANQNKTDPSAPQAPFYQFLQVPGQSVPTFNLTTTLTFQKRPNLAAFVAASSGPGDDYGTIRVLQLPSQTSVQGPGQVAGNFEAKPEVSSLLTLLRQGGSTVTLGNLLTLPVAGGLLFVEPVYVASSAGETFPTLKDVIVAFGDRLGFAPTLSAALDQALGSGAGSTAPGGVSSPNPSATPTPTATPSTPSVAPSVAPSGPGLTLAQAVTDAVAAQRDADAALAKSPPDFAGYGQAQQRLRADLARISALTGQPSATPGTGGGSAPPGASPAPGTSPTAAPTPAPAASP